MYVIWIFLSVYVFYFYICVIVKMCWYVCKLFIGIILVIKNLYLYVIKVIGYCIVEKFIEVILFWKFLLRK